MHVLLEPRDVDDAVDTRANPEKVLDEIQAYQERYGATNFDFYDLTAIVKRSWIIEFTQLILERKMKFTWQLPSGTRSEAIDDEVSRLLYESGCRNMSYAPGERLAGSAQADQEGRQARSARSVGAGRRAQRAEREAEHHHGISRTNRRKELGADRAAFSFGWDWPACTT